MEYGWQNRDYGGLPEAGGLRAQPVRLIRTITACMNAYNAVKSYANIEVGGLAAWEQAHPELVDLIALIDEEETHE